MITLTTTSVGSRLNQPSLALSVLFWDVIYFFYRSQDVGEFLITVFCGVSEKGDKNKAARTVMTQL